MQGRFKPCKIAKMHRLERAHLNRIRCITWLTMNFHRSTRERYKSFKTSTTWLRTSKRSKTVSSPLVGSKWWRTSQESKWCLWTRWRCACQTIKSWSTVAIQTPSSLTINSWPLNSKACCIESVPRPRVHHNSIQITKAQFQIRIQEYSSAINTNSRGVNSIGAARTEENT